MKKVRNVILGISVALFSATATEARTSLVVDQSVFKYNTDTVKVNTTIDPATMFLGNVVCKKPSKYKHVPLATDAEYFNDKSGYITDYTTKYMNNFNSTINTVKARSKGIFPLMDYILEANELPKELKYLSVIESALDNDAISWVGAAGPWQFMDFTGREMGLTVNNIKDERTDWVRSTEAAAKYMKQLYTSLDDWLLVIAAYNSGPGPVYKAMKKTGSNNFWVIKDYLPKETQNHVLKFVATATIFEQGNTFNSLNNVNPVNNIIVMK